MATALAVLLVVAGGTATVVGLAGRGAEEPPALPARVVAGPTEPISPSDGATGPGDVAASSGGATDAASVAPSAGADAGTGGSGPAEADDGGPVAAPVAVRVPGVGITSDLLRTGMRDDGTLEVPEGDDFDTAAWFDGSPRPGEVGPAVLLGHVSSRARGPSVFYDLPRLRPGDVVEVDREDGSTATFEVYRLEQFPKDEFPTLQVYGNTAGPELRLITCGGTIAESSGRFEDNVVVFARLVGA